MSDEADSFNEAPTNESAASPLPQGWTKIGDRRWWTMWSNFQWLFVLLIAANGGNVAVTVARGWHVPIWIVVGGLAGILVLVFAATTIIRNRRWPTVEVNLANSELRVGDDAVPLASVTAAQLAVFPVRRRDPALALRLTSLKPARAEVFLRDRRGHTLPDDQRLLFTEAVRRTSIAMPVSRDDPSGRFARYNFPGHVSLEDTVQLIARPPSAGEALPVPS